MLPRLVLIALFALALVAPARAAETYFAVRVAPVLAKNCTACHGEKKQKAGLRLDSIEAILRGSENGPALKSGDAASSEIFRRISLPAGHEDIMPSDGKPPLKPAEIKILGTWIAAGASATQPLTDFETPAPPHAPAGPAAPDWRPFQKKITAFEEKFGLRLVPVSREPADGLILRTASSPAQCDDATLLALKPLADLIVEAELARTPVTDVGLKSVATWKNLRRLDLSRTAVTTEGVLPLAKLSHLETLTLIATAVDQPGAEAMRVATNLREVYWLPLVAVARP